MEEFLMKTSGRANYKTRCQISKNFNTSKQMDGAVDTSDEDESEESDDNMDDDDNDDLDKDDDEDIENEGGAEEEPLNSEDDVTDEDASDLFDTENVIVCQYDKITRSRNKWKFYLKDGIMNIGGKDYITLPAQPGTMNSESRVLTIHVPASALQENQLTQILTAHLISSIMSLPTTLASSVLQQHVNAALVNANMQTTSFRRNTQLAQLFYHLSRF
uniref:Uncharacterized protein n=1 Tax=Glossina brevipalpis TaxID=37001 RepID=A0A1A9WJS9_9MUSC